MTPVARPARPGMRHRVHRNREIGPLGTVSRVVAGCAAVAVPIAVSGIGWREAAAALVGFPVVAAIAALAVTGGYRRWAPRALARGRQVCSGPTCVMTALLFAVAFVLDALTSIDGDVAFWVWIGASMLLAAVRGYAGCELLAFPNALTGRRDQIGCILFSAIDAAETGRQRRADPIATRR
jgi:hypothetical protein